MLVDRAPDPRHPAPVLAREILDAVLAWEAAWNASHGGQGGSNEVARRAQMSRSQLANIKAAIEEDPDHVLRTNVAKRLLRAVGKKLAVVDDPEPASFEEVAGRRP